MYREIQKSNFQFEHCWNVLRHQPKWVAHVRQCSSKKRQLGSSYSSTQVEEHVNLDDDNTPNSACMDLPRPVGKKAEKERAKKGKWNDKIEIWLEEKRKMHEQKIRLHEQKVSLLAQDIDIEKKRIDIQERQEDVKIMMVDTSTLSAVQKEYFDSLQAEIVAKRMGSY